MHGNPDDRGRIYYACPDDLERRVCCSDDPETRDGCADDRGNAMYPMYGAASRLYRELRRVSDGHVSDV